MRARAAKKDEFQSGGSMARMKVRSKAGRTAWKPWRAARRPKKGSVETGEGSMEATGSGEVRESNSSVAKGSTKIQSSRKADKGRLEVPQCNIDLGEPRVW